MIVTHDVSRRWHWQNKKWSPSFFCHTKNTSCLFIEESEDYKWYYHLFICLTGNSYWKSVKKLTLSTNLRVDSDECLLIEQSFRLKPFRIEVLDSWFFSSPCWELVKRPFFLNLFMPRALGSQAILIWIFVDGFFDD